MITSLLAIVAAAQIAPPQAPTSGDTVIVTAKRLSDLQAAHAACIARGCPPDTEIDAALAVVERQFVDGDYQLARDTAAASVARNKRFARQYPVAVSDLQRSLGRIGAHMGEPKAYRNATIGALGALKAGLPDDDVRVLGARIELADMQARTGAPDLALLTYRDIVRRGRAQDRPMVTGMGLLRIAMLAAAAGERDREAELALASLATDPAMQRFAVAARLVAARAAARRGDAGAIERMIAGLPRSQRPSLLYAPPVTFERESPGTWRRGSKGSIFAIGEARAVGRQWIDVGFWIRPDGTVGDADVLRASPEIVGGWPRLIVDAVARRRYSPTTAEPGDPGIFRVERHSFTADWTEAGLRVRSSRPKIEILDLTDDAPPPVDSASDAAYRKADAPTAGVVQ